MVEQKREWMWRGLNYKDDRYQKRWRFSKDRCYGQKQYQTIIKFYNWIKWLGLLENKLNTTKIEYYVSSIIEEKSKKINFFEYDYGLLLYMLWRNSEE